MHTKITLKNYRCFSDEHPAVFELRPGFTSFIGINNAGKSTLLRFLYEFRNLFKQLSENALDATIRDARNGTTHNFAVNFPVQITDFSALYHNSNDRPFRIECELVDPLRSNRYTVKLRGERTLPQFFYIELWKNNDRVAIPGATLGPGELPRIKTHFAALANTLYIGPFRNAVNSGANDSYFDLAIGSAFINLWDQWKHGTVIRDNDAANALTEEIQNLFGFTDLEINAAPDKSAIKVRINRKTYVLDELGAGLAEFIIILANAAIKNPDYILIDEPELHLHPALQLDFLTALGSYAKQGTLFATHTVGLARSVADPDQTYTIRRTPQQCSQLEPYTNTPNLSQLLGELSFSNLQTVGYDIVLLVEGPTEVKTIQELLRLYGKQHRVVLVPLGGSSLIRPNRQRELAEFARLAPTMAALLDSERATQGGNADPDHQAFANDCDASGIPCKLLDRRAIENYFPEHAIHKAFDSTYSVLGPYDPLKNAPKPWNKRDNYRIASHMTEPDLAGTDLGTFLAAL